MTGEEDNAHGSDGKAGPPDAPPRVEPARLGIPWLLGHKVELPDPIEGYVERPELEARCALTRRCLTVLHAPGGFGKTALLGHCARTLREQGVAVAWLSLDEEDGPGSLTAYLALAFEGVGVKSYVAGGGSIGAAAMSDAPDAEADSQADYRINLLIGAIERHGAPCVLALDEVDWIRSPEAISALNALLRRAPGNLHVGMAYRERPPGLDVAMFELEGRSATLTVEDLRFSAPDVSSFFERRLSRRELGSVVANSGGWPIALRIYRNANLEGASKSGADGGGDLAAAWIETRLWRGISEEDRNFVLDVALFDSVDQDLIEEAAGVRNAGRRLASMGPLAGLFSTSGGDGSEMRLQPIIKDYCERRRFEETPERFRALHRKIAEALARRGRLAEALRHAVEAGNTDLLGRLAEQTGGVRLWLEEGLVALRAVDRLLSEEVLSRYPRLGLLRCVALTVSGDVEAAKRIYHATAARTEDFTRDREGGDDEALQVENILVSGLVKMCGCTQYGIPLDELVPLATAVIAGPAAGPMFRGLVGLGICMVANQEAEFDAAFEWAECAREDFGPSSPYLAHVEFQIGSIEMARGHTSAALTHYDRALSIARAGHLRDARAMMLGQVLVEELEFERSAGTLRIKGAKLSPRLLGECGAWLDIYFAHAEVSTELARLRGGPHAALAVIGQAYDFARRTGREAFTRFLSALRVSVLAAEGKVDEANRVWRLGRLPEDVEGCLDLEAQSWRDLEMVATARIRLFIAQGEFDAGRTHGRALLAFADERGLVRTSMRGRALAMVLEHCAGDDARARDYLSAYLKLFSTSGYVRPLARCRTVALPLLDEVAAAGPADDPVTKGAAWLGNALRETSTAGADVSHAPLTERELEVLVRLENHRDREIAEILNLSYDGLRYRVNRIFTKLGARSRLDAVHLARARGLLPRSDKSSAIDR